MAGIGAKRPADSEFGLGPRVSANQKYTATLQPREPLRLRRLQTVPVLITDASGRPVEQASFTVDGGMPEHLHGLPTQPRIGRSLGGGVRNRRRALQHGRVVEFKPSSRPPVPTTSRSISVSDRGAP
jgi:hypothetical protein